MATLGSCSIAYDVDVVPRFGAVTFGFLYFRLPFVKDHSALVDDVRVEEVSTRRIVWHVETSDLFKSVKLSAMTYGRDVPGLRTTTKSTRLRVGKLYNVEMRGAGGGGRRLFVLLSEDDIRAGDISVLRIR